MFAHRNTLARQLKALHISGTPLILTNCYDGATAKFARHAAATASYAIASSRGITDAELTLEENIESIRQIAKVTDAAAIPLTADLQDGYDDIVTTITKAIEAGAVGANIEDSIEAGSIRAGLQSDGQLRPLAEAVSCVSQAVHTATSLGVPDFCINARTDAFRFTNLDDAIERGRAFLKAGATSVYVLGKGPVPKETIQTLVNAFEGRLNIKMYMPGNAREIAELGVSRISLGPDLYRRAIAAYESGVQEVLLSIG